MQTNCFGGNLWPEFFMGLGIHCRGRGCFSDKKKGRLSCQASSDFICTSFMDFLQSKTVLEDRRWGGIEESQRHKTQSGLCNLVGERDMSTINHNTWLHDEPCSW